MTRSFLLLALLGLAACRRTPAPQSASTTPPVDPAAITAALNTWLQVNPACYFVVAVGLPHRYSSEPANRTFASLVDAGLLTSTPLKQAVLIDFTPAGRSAWHADLAHPGQGNFCYATPQVASMDSAQSVQDPIFGPAYDVQFTTRITGPHAAWADLPAIQQADPRIRQELSGSLPNTATVKLVEGHWRIAAANVHAAIAPDPLIISEGVTP